MGLMKYTLELLRSCAKPSICLCWRNVAPLRLVVSWVRELLVSEIVLFHNSFSPRDDQPEQRILAYKTEQPTAGFIAIFPKYCFYYTILGYQI